MMTTPIGVTTRQKEETVNQESPVLPRTVFNDELGKTLTFVTKEGATYYIKIINRSTGRSLVSGDRFDREVPNLIRFRRTPEGYLRFHLDFGDFMETGIIKKITDDNNADVSGILFVKPKEEV
mgnify:CR=1 FL=1